MKLPPVTVRICHGASRDGRSWLTAHIVDNNAQGADLLWPQRTTDAEWAKRYITALLEQRRVTVGTWIERKD